MIPATNGAGCRNNLLFKDRLYNHICTVLTKDGIEYTPIISTTTAIINFSMAFLSVFRGSHNKLI